MPLLVVGTVAFDSIESPHGKVDNAIGGSAVHFSLAASLFTSLRLVSVVGKDFPAKELDRLRSRGVDLAGLDVQEGKSFRWSGRYKNDMNEAETLDTQLNVYGDFQPKVPASFAGTPFVFLANGSPKSQLAVLEQMEGTPFVAADTMNLWINTTRPELTWLLKKVDLLVINEGEARLLTEKPMLIQAGRSILEMGPRMVVIKAGEFGSYLFSRDFEFALPAYPTVEVRDPTGAGDSFAGGMLGYLASCDSMQEADYRKAMAYGTIVSSFAVEQFSIQGLQDLSREAIDARFREFESFIRL